MKKNTSDQHYGEWSLWN